MGRAVAGSCWGAHEQRSSRRFKATSIWVRRSSTFDGILLAGDAMRTTIWTTMIGIPAMRTRSIPGHFRAVSAHSPEVCGYACARMSARSQAARPPLRSPP
eukprot:6185279-Pleurochrysis_carterae.AAC.5